MWGTISHRDCLNGHLKKKNKNTKTGYEAYQYGVSVTCGQIFLDYTTLCYTPFLVIWLTF